ncbi:MAG: chemotaxis protein CheW [Bdellovibrionota bacterium]
MNAQKGLSRVPPPPVIKRAGGERRRRNDGPPNGVERRRGDGDRRVENNVEYVSFFVAGQLLGISVVKVQEILPPQRFTMVPQAAQAVEGLLNLRGQIVTVVDLRRRLGFPPRELNSDHMNIIVDDGGELFSFLADSVGDVIGVSRDKFSAPPATLDQCWKQCCEGVYQMQKGLLIVLGVQSLLNLEFKV